MGLPELTELDLSRSAVTDEGLRSIAAFQTLEILEISGPGITDAAIEHLARLSKLRKLIIDDTRIDGWGRLRKALPNAMIGPQMGFGHLKAR